MTDMIQQRGPGASNAHTIRALVGGEPAAVRALSPDATWVRTEAGQELVVKRVPRQERSHWRPGRPWVELVTLDLLAAAGGPVPRLLAADLEGGWLVLAYVPGKTLLEAAGCAGDTCFAALTDAVVQVESILQEEEEAIRSFLPDPPTDDAAPLIEAVEAALLPEAAAQWRSLVLEAFAGARRTLGSLDLQPGNALAAGERVLLIDFSVVGWTVRERRLVAYAHRSRPRPGTILTQSAYAAYRDRAGDGAALRLAVYDMAYALRLLAGRAGLGLAGEELDDALRLWRRPRLDDRRLAAVCDGLDWKRLKEVGRRWGKGL